jgi:hypothetical protein
MIVATPFFPPEYCAAVERMVAWARSVPASMKPHQWDRLRHRDGSNANLPFHGPKRAAPMLVTSGAAHRIISEDGPAMFMLPRAWGFPNSLTHNLKSVLSISSRFSFEQLNGGEEEPGGGTFNSCLEIPSPVCGPQAPDKHGRSTGLRAGGVHGPRRIQPGRNLTRSTRTT